MNALILVLPVILLRYGLLSLISSEALHRAGHFPPVEGKEKITFWVYQLTTILMFIFSGLQPVNKLMVIFDITNNFSNFRPFFN